MSGLFKDLKIARSIIKFISVEVMNRFAWFKFSANLFFHDKPVFKHISVPIRRVMPFAHDPTITFDDDKPSFPKMMMFSLDKVLHAIDGAKKRLCYGVFKATWQTVNRLFAIAAKRANLFNAFHIQYPNTHKGGVNA